VTYAGELSRVNLYMEPFSYVGACHVFMDVSSKFQTSFERNETRVVYTPGRSVRTAIYNCRYRLPNESYRLNSILVGPKFYYGTTLANIKILFR
jgi:hypothetical protein